ncbi:CBS domain-containing protein [Thiomicrospira microaerophila]|uniref:putative nucleotidyltransferase substrate binding domain-containing protein n=1 Tax=Thiomicrospira microaerophila TaxID=406020 RepID=UPI00200E03A1|nr:putative nucleotidyltransferase substrate binding domain-containing protein [Thiomicrospira microaerophila]UQB43050.1 CBS domain-containing protein [Thiomicrospira microaerophila]
MSILEQTRFLQAVHPFDRLDQAWLEEAAAALDVVYFAQEDQIPLDTTGHAFLYIVMKGRVSECQDDEGAGQCAIYGTNAQFGASTLLDQKAKLNYHAIEETLVYRLPNALFQKLLNHNPDFEAFYFNDITEKLSRFHQQLQIESSSEAMMDAVKIAPLHALVEISCQTSIKACVEQMETHKTDACLVKDGEQLGVITSSDLLRGLAIHGFDLSSPIADMVSYPVISIHQNDYLFNALLKMTRYGVDRLMVRDKQGFIGVLHQKELMSLFANQSGLVMLTLERAESFDDLKKVTQQIDDLVAGLSNKGVKTHYIAKLVNELHRKLQAKLWQVLDQEQAFNEATFIVMGSEGRSEQVVRTDQDNAVVFAETVDEAALAQFCQSYSAKLIELGFPPCPGNIMVSNSAWRLSQSAFEQQILRWFENPSLDSFMNLAILFDAQAVQGDSARLDRIKQVLQQQVNKRQMFLPQFARSVLQFETPIGLFGRLITQKDQGHSIDLKKGGIFPIVHGVRCLALELGIEKTNTHWRIRELINRNVFDEAFGVELGETLNFLNTLRLQAMLEKKLLGNTMDNAIETDHLNHFQQDLLKDAFGVVNKFKKFIEQHFKMDALL